MPFCPKCKAEYRKGFKICADCNEKLVDVLEEDKKNDYKNGSEKWVYLMSTYNDVEADIVIGLLNNYGIKAIKQYSGPYQYLKVYMGTAFNVKILVPESLLNQAKEIIENTVI